jgi:predicted nucleic acid-binding protein
MSQTKIKMKVYLDNCSLNRPFDDQSRIRIRLETEAKLYIQDKIKNQSLDLVWSYILDIENDNNPFKEKRRVIARWKTLSTIDVSETQSIIDKANGFVKIGVKAKDALHVACAINGNANLFITTNDKLIKKLCSSQEINVLNPIDAAGQIDDSHN